MSKKSRAIHSVRRAAHQAGGSGLTRAARVRTMERLVLDAYAHGEQIVSIAGLKEKHIAGHIGRLRASDGGQRGISSRTACNRMTDIRQTLRAGGRPQAADSQTISNRALGIGGASREGTKTAATPEQYQAARAAAEARDPGIAVITQLQEALGLRLEEAVQAGPSLPDWARQIGRGGPAGILHGTKGGKARNAPPVSKERALAAIAAAQAVAKQRGGRLLPGTLKQAMSRADTEWKRYLKPASGITSHQMRYAYARERVAQAEREGLSRPEALARTSLELGHGDGRGRYVERTYLR